MSHQLTVNENKNISVFSREEFPHYMEIASKMASSDMVPKGYKGKPMDILIAIQMGYDLGLPMMQALQDIAVINGKPTIYGDGLLAIVQSHPDCEYIKEEPLLKGDSISGYICRVKRKGYEEHASVFTIDDAKKASLWGKAGPWSQYPNRMLQMRARGFALRDIFADALRGIKCAEEVQDNTIIEGRVTNKVTQSDKVNLLLSKKGLAHENKGTLDSGALVDANYQSNIDPSDALVLSASKTLKDKPGETKNNNEMDANRIPNNSPKDEEGLHIPATQTQLDAIDCLIHEKDFKPDRVSKAFKHFGVSSFASMSEQQACEMIKILGGIEPQE